MFDSFQAWYAIGDNAYYTRVIVVTLSALYLLFAAHSIFREHRRVGKLRAKLASVSTELTTALMSRNSYVEELARTELQLAETRALAKGLAEVKPPAAEPVPHEIHLAEPVATLLNEVVVNVRKIAVALESLPKPAFPVPRPGEFPVPPWFNANLNFGEEMKRRMEESRLQAELQAALEEEVRLATADAAPPAPQPTSHYAHWQAPKS